MTDREIASEIDGQAEYVAGWLHALFERRPVWLSSELAMRAHAEGIDLLFWLVHPTVKAMGIGEAGVPKPGCTTTSKVYVLAREDDPCPGAVVVS